MISKGTLKRQGRKRGGGRERAGKEAIFHFIPSHILLVSEPRNSSIQNPLPPPPPQKKLILQQYKNEIVHCLCSPVGILGHLLCPGQGTAGSKPCRAWGWTAAPPGGELCPSSGFKTLPGPYPTSSQRYPAISKTFKFYLVFQVFISIISTWNAN